MDREGGKSIKSISEMHGKWCKPSGLMSQIYLSYVAMRKAVPRGFYTSRDSMNSLGVFPNCDLKHSLK